VSWKQTRSVPRKPAWLPDSLAWLLAAAALAREPQQNWTRAEGNLRQAAPLLQDGDIIFIRVANVLYRKVAETSGSWESHVGLLFQNRNGTWAVAESTIPFSKFTPLARFVARSEHGRFLVRRLKGGLNPAEKLRLRHSAEARMGKAYHLGFNYDSSRQFCSKLVFDTYREATGHHTGRLQTFRELISANPAAPLGFWRLWFFGAIPWQRRCVTTTSEIRAPNCATVFDSEKAGSPGEVSQKPPQVRPAPASPRPRHRPAHRPGQPVEPSARSSQTRLTTPGPP